MNIPMVCKGVFCLSRARNPEKTRRKILDVAEALFLEKGYDGTSIQDIIDGLGGLTKGVIYHHFDSKFAILETVMSEAGEEPPFGNWHGANGLEKIQNSLKASFTAYKKQEIGYSAAVTLRSPRILGEQYLKIFQELVPEIQKAVDEGVQDGSIKTDYPEEIAELLMLTLNLWIGFRVSELSEEDLKRKILFIKKTFEGLGVPLLTDDLVKETFQLFSILKK